MVPKIRLSDQDNLRTAHRRPSIGKAIQQSEEFTTGSVGIVHDNEDVHSTACVLAYDCFDFLGQRLRRFS